MTKTLTTADTSRMLRRIRAALADDPRLPSPNTKRGYLHDLAAFETWRAGKPYSKLLVESYAAHLQRAGKSPKSINRALVAIRWWARRVADLAHEDRSLSKAQRNEYAEQAARVATVRDVKGERLPKGRHVSPGELASLMRACDEDESPAGVRDSALIALAWVTGARRAELAALEVGDVHWNDDDEAAIIIRKGKGDKQRTAYANDGAAAALRDWLKIRGDGSGPMFYPITKSGKVQRDTRRAGLRGRKGEAVEVPARLSTEALAQMLAKRAEQAGLSEPITWHDFRRTFAGNLLDANNDLVTVQKLLGHSSPTTTSNYDRRGEEVKRRAVRSLHVPYKRRKG